MQSRHRSATPSPEPAVRLSRPLRVTSAGRMHPLNRISIRGAAVATAMAGTSLIAATGIAAFAGDPSAAADTMRAGQRQGGVPQNFTHVSTSRLEPALAVRSAAPQPKPSATAHRASRAGVRAGLSPRTLGRLMAADRGWTGAQWACLDSLWTRESNWQVHAANRSSGAYGIPQSLPARKMASAGSDWRTSARTQITWGLGYIKSAYGSPCRAWRHSENYGYY